MSDKNEDLLPKNDYLLPKNDYLLLENPPDINGVKLVPNMEIEDIGIQEMTPNMVSELYLEIMGFIL